MEARGTLPVARYSIGLIAWLLACGPGGTNPEGCSGAKGSAGKLEYSYEVPEGSRRPADRAVAPGVRGLLRIVGTDQPETSTESAAPAVLVLRPHGRESRCLTKLADGGTMIETDAGRCDGDHQQLEQTEVLEFEALAPGQSRARSRGPDGAEVDHLDLVVARADALALYDHERDAWLNVAGFEVSDRQALGVFAREANNRIVVTDRSIRALVEDATVLALTSASQPEPSAEVELASGDVLGFAVRRVGGSTTLRLTLGDISRTYTVVAR